MATIEQLMAGADLKQTYAGFHFERMGQALEVHWDDHTAAMRTAGMIVHNDWHRAFFAHFDAFLSANRSVAFVVKACLGVDRVGPMRQWFDSLRADEQERRREFDAQMATQYTAFNGAPLTEARHVSVHRRGYADVQVEVRGSLGVTYPGGPTQPVPVSETPHLDDGQYQPWMQARQIDPPNWSEFTIGNESLRDVVLAQINAAGTFLAAAREVAPRVHGGYELTAPPG